MMTNFISFRNIKILCINFFIAVSYMIFKHVLAYSFDVTNAHNERLITTRGTILSIRWVRWIFTYCLCWNWLWCRLLWYWWNYCRFMLLGRLQLMRMCMALLTCECGLNWWRFMFWWWYFEWLFWWGLQEWRSCC